MFTEKNFLGSCSESGKSATQDQRLSCAGNIGCQFLCSSVINCFLRAAAQFSMVRLRISSSRTCWRSSGLIHTSEWSISWRFSCSTKLADSMTKDVLVRSVWSLSITSFTRWASPLRSIGVSSCQASIASSTALWAAYCSPIFFPGSDSFFTVRESIRPIR